MQKVRFKTCRWIMLALAILFNGFIISYSCMTGEQSNKLNRFITNVYTNVINTFTKKDVKEIKVSGIEAKMSSAENYKYNDIPGYAFNEIPLGSAKQLEFAVSPVDASNKSFTVEANPSQKVKLNKSGDTISVVGLEKGKCVITAKSGDGGFESSVEVNIVDTVAPVQYEVSLSNNEIPLGSFGSLTFDIDGGVLTHNELINFRYYDIRKLTYSSLDEGVATVDQYGIIHPVSLGSTSIQVKNGDFAKSVDITVVSGGAPITYTDLKISGSSVCYENDMIQDQSSKKNHYQLTPMDGEIALNPEDFIWQSNNELLAKVDSHGVLRGFRKSTISDETVQIKAISKINGAEATFEVVVKNQLPTKLNYYVVISGRDVWNEKEYTIFVGDEVVITLNYDIYSLNVDTEVSNSNNDVVAISNNGKQIKLYVLTEGNTDLTITSKIDSSLSHTIRFYAIRAGAISDDSIESVGYSLRKSVGHAAVFMVAQIFTFLAIYMFLYDKKWWLYSSISVGEGFILCLISEFIQLFIPSRGGSIADVFIDFVGVVVGFAVIFGSLILIKVLNKKKEAKQNTLSKK